MNCYRSVLVLAVGISSALASGACNSSCCAPRKSVRAIDRTCLPVCRSVNNIELYRGDIDAQYVQIATIDSFVGNDECTHTLQAMLRDLKSKAQGSGADAVIRVKLLRNKVRGWTENMRTPFWSVEQGRWEEPFFRGIAIKYQRWPEGTPEERAERPLNIDHPEERKKGGSSNPLKRGTRSFGPALGAPRL
jgi:hypothetical protein